MSNREKKYQLTGKPVWLRGHKVYRIQAARNFGDVKIGMIGGYVEKETNLSHKGDCWIYHDAAAFGDAAVRDNAKVCDDALVYGDALVCGDAHVTWHAEVHGRSVVMGRAGIGGYAKVFDLASVSDDACVYDDARVFGCACVGGCAHVLGKSEVYGDSFVDCTSHILGKSRIGSNRDFMVFKNSWEHPYKWITCCRVEGGGVMWNVGCFYGTGEELVEKAYKDSELSGDCYKMTVKMAEKIFAKVNLKTN